MTTPISKIKPLKALSNPFIAFNELFQGPEQPGAQATTATAAPPQPAPPAQTPTGATGTAGNLAQTQLSFLTAASKAAAAIGQGATGGKSLLGA